MIDVKAMLKQKAGDFLQVNESNIILSLQQMYEGRVELLRMEDALKRPGVKRRMGSLLGRDKFSRKALEERTGGYFVRVLKNQHVDVPIQTCILLNKAMEQKPYNMIVMEEGAKATVYTGCSAAAITGEAFHIGATEFFVGKGAQLNYVMLHVWPEGVEVRPRSAAHVEEGGSFNSAYVVLRPGAIIQANPKVYLEKGASGHLTSILRGEGSTKLDIGGELHFKGEGASGILESRSVLGGRSQVRVAAKLVAEAPAKGHVDCRAILTSEQAQIEAVPIIESNQPDAALTHEASVGKIQEDQLFYLQARGFSEEQARQMIVKGFLSPDMPWLGDRMRQEIDRVVSLSAKGS
jgi:Fe-S cluster assembly scaffold protein SufB